MTKVKPVFVISIEKYKNNELVDFIADHVEEDHTDAIAYARQVAMDIYLGKLVLMGCQFKQPVITSGCFRYIVFNSGSQKDRIEVVYNWTRV